MALEKPNLNKLAFRIPAFAKEVELIKQGKCPMCEKEIREEDFHSERNKREYTVNGLCQECQDKVQEEGERLENE